MCPRRVQTLDEASTLSDRPAHGCFCVAWGTSPGPKGSIPHPCSNIS